MALLVLEPKTLLLDEPFASLDLQRSKRLAERLWSLPQRVIVSSHDLEALAHCDEVIWLDAGRPMMQGGAIEVIAAYRAWANSGEPRAAK
jgi:biotin transport system ATP-binding protein